jgi:hypothetical protein
MPSLSAKLARQKAERIPPGWLSAEQLAVKENYSTVESLRHSLPRFIKAGLLETRQFRVSWGTYTRLKTHYRYTSK